MAMPWKPVDEDSYNIAIPLYYQVQNMMLDTLFRNLRPGDKLPTEKELCHIYKVSRSTMRQAMEFLVREGYVERFKGRGTFLVQKPHPVYNGSDRSSIPTLNLACTADHPTGVVSKAIAIMDSTALREGYLLTFTNLDHNIAELESHLRSIMSAHHLSGIVYFPVIETGAQTGKNERLLALYRQMGIPVVVIDRLPIPEEEIRNTELDKVSSYSSSADYNYVLPDNLKGGFLATSHLLSCGHRNVAFLGGVVSQPSFLREHGYRKAMTEAGIADAVHVVRDEQFFYDSGRPLELLSSFRDAGVTAVFAEYDLVAKELYNAAVQAGMEIPGDISIIGYDDLDFCQYLSPPLTTIRQPLEDELKTAIDILFMSIEKPSSTLRHVILPVELIQRESTGPPASG